MGFRGRALASVCVAGDLSSVAQPNFSPGGCLLCGLCDPLMDELMPCACTAVVTGPMCTGMTARYTLPAIATVTGVQLLQRGLHHMRVVLHWFSEGRWLRPVIQTKEAPCMAAQSAWSSAQSPAQSSAQSSAHALASLSPIPQQCKPSRLRNTGCRAPNRSSTQTAYLHRMM